LGALLLLVLLERLVLLILLFLLARGAGLAGEAFLGLGEFFGGLFLAF
jgi:hypothetical protein